MIPDMIKLGIEQEVDKYALAQKINSIIQHLSVLPKECAPKGQLNLLVSCAEWHEQQATLEREDMDSKGDPGTEHWDECLAKISMHCKYANALRATASS